MLFIQTSLLFILHSYLHHSLTHSFSLTLPSSRICASTVTVASPRRVNWSGMFDTGIPMKNHTNVTNATMPALSWVNWSVTFVVTPENDPIRYGISVHYCSFPTPFKRSNGSDFHFADFFFIVLPCQCPHCTYASPDTFKLKRHLRIHTGEKVMIFFNLKYSLGYSNHFKLFLIEIIA